MAFDLSSVITTELTLLPPKIIIYGVGGIGKTTFAAGAPKPIFLFTEEGQGKIQDLPRFKAVAKTWQNVLDSVGMLYEQEHDYQTFVLDNLYFLEPLLHRHTCEKYHQDSINDPTSVFGYNKGYDKAVEEAGALLDSLDMLRNDRGMSIVLIGHSKVKHFKDPNSEGYDQYQLDLNDKLGLRVRNWCDALLFLNYRTHVVTDGAGKSKERKRGVGVGERIIYTEDRPPHWAKNRYGLPPEIEIPTQASQSVDPAACWRTFQDAIVVDSTPKEEQKENS